MKKIAKFLSLTAAVMALGAFFMSCEPFWNSGNEGTLTVLLTDAPFPADLVDQANVTIDSLSIREKGGDDGDPFLTLSTDQRSFNLLDLRNGAFDSLVADLDIPIGTYNLLRLYISDASVVDTSGETIPLTIPGGDESGLKLFIKPDLLVGTDERVEILLDIDVSKSFVVQGQPHSAEGITGFTFKPVVRVVNQSTAGRLVGTVTDTSSAANPIADAQVWVWSVELDSVISNTFTDTTTGDYQLIGLAAGFYTAYATVAGHDTVSFTDVEIKAATATERDFALTPTPQ